MKLKNYACDVGASRGRKYVETYEGYLSSFQRDRDRIIHSMAFRRLEYKTQVFVNHVGDHYRTRLTHSLEVSQIARVMSRELGLNEDLAECISLAHDLGHPPFGHAGEEALHNITKEFGGFDHNAQTLKILTYLEQRYAEYDGLNLTWETLEGIAKHNGPLEGKYKTKSELHKIYNDITKHYDLELNTFPSLEAQIASIADDIAYISHDLDDGLRAECFTIEEIKKIPLLAEIFAMLGAKYGNLSEQRLINETTRRLMQYMIIDIINETNRRIEDLKINDVSMVRSHSSLIAVFSNEMEETKTSLKKFLFDNLYRHYKVNRMTLKAKNIIQDLFLKLMECPNCLPTNWYHKILDIEEVSKAEIIMDYISGMTDRYAIEEHRKLFDPLLY